MENYIAAFILETFNTILNLLSIYIFFDKILLAERCKYEKKVKICSWIIVFAIGYLWQIIYLAGNRNLIIYGIAFFVYYTRSLIILWNIFRRKYIHIVTILLYQLTISVVAQLLYMIIPKVQILGLYSSFLYHVVEVVTIGLSIIVIMVIAYCKKNFFFYIYLKELSLAQQIIFLIALGLSGLICTYVIFYKEYDIQLEIMSILNILSTTLIIIQVTVNRENLRRKDEVIDILDGQMEKQLAYYNEIKERQLEMQKFRHDIKGFTFNLHALIVNNRYEEALTCIEEMNELCKNTTQKYDTGNVMADTLISAKSAVAEKNSAKIVFSGIIPREGINSSDLIVLLCNLLDNAIEACEKMEGEKVISIISEKYRDTYILIVKNPIQKKVDIQNNHITTTKEDKNLHGFGIQNVKRIASKYGGRLKITSKDGEFSAEVTMRL